MKDCPACGEEIKDAARKCRFCGEMVSSSGGSRSGSSRRKKSNSNATVWIIVGVVVGGLLISACAFVFVIPAMMLPAVQQARGAARRSMSKNNLKQIGLALHNYHDVHATLPPGAVVDTDDRMHHGWQTQLLPYLDQAPLYNRIDFGVPWDDPRNAGNFQAELKILLIPGISETRDSTGLGLSHYSGNVNLFDRNSSVRFRDFSDGTSNTIMAGETAAGFQPWGKPGNWRDPATGINTGPNSFGGPFGGAQILLGDGSVRFLSDDVNPQILKALSTPGGGEDVGEY